MENYVIVSSIYVLAVCTTNSLTWVIQSAYFNHRRLSWSTRIVCLFLAQHDACLILTSNLCIVAIVDFRTISLPLASSSSGSGWSGGLSLTHPPVLIADVSNFFRAAACWLLKSCVSYLMELSTCWSFFLVTGSGLLAETLKSCTMRSQTTSFLALMSDKCTWDMWSITIPSLPWCWMSCSKRILSVVDKLNLISVQRN